LPNLLLTNICNRKCPYCFALAQIEAGTTEANWQMSIEELEVILSYLDPRKDVVSLLGGEPTLHSDFKQIVQRVCDDGFDVKIFTNGVTKSLRDIHGISKDSVRIILNLNSPDSYNEREWKQIEKNGSLFQDQIVLSFNVYQKDFSWDYIKKAIRDWGLNPFVRIGLAQPIKGMGNSFLQETDMKEAGSKLVQMAEDCATEGITLGFDCGFRSCTFSQEQLGILAECGTNLLFVCKPVLDIGPQLDVWRCFPFSVGPGVTLTDFKSIKELEDYFTDQWSSMQKIGNIDACGDCEKMQLSTCNGGCLSRTFLRTESIQTTISDIS